MCDDTDDDITLRLDSTDKRILLRSRSSQHPYTGSKVCWLVMITWLVAVSVFYLCPSWVRTQCASSAIYTLRHDLRVKWGNYKHHQVWKVSKFDSCKPHHFCPSWLGQRKKFFACGYGFYNLNRDSTSSNDCLPCPAGKYCLAGVFDCEPGYYCPGDGLPREPWPGYYAPNAGMSKPLVCPIGTIQPVVQHIKWEWRGITECIRCKKNRYCDTTRLLEPAGDCEDGWNCDIGETSPTPVGKKCAKGNYCRKGSSYRCNPGMYQPNEAMDGCFNCPEGMYCAASELENPTGICDPGWFCDSRATSPQPSGKLCPAGYMCPDGKKTPCGRGYYQPNAGQITCIPCPVGKFCSSTALQSPSGNCDPGCCLETAQIHQSSCPPGIATSCSQGFYEDKNTSSCVLCPKGMYCAISGLSEPSGLCSDGWYCDSGEITPNPLGKYCPAGHKCVTGIKEECGPVAYRNDLFEYQPNRGQKSCVPCPNKFNCTQPALADPTSVCADGYSCKNGIIKLCEPDNYCIRGRIALCPRGFKQPNAGQSQCVRCEDGVVCEDGKKLPCPTYKICYNGLAHDCPLGYECTLVNGVNVVTPCAPGTERYEINSTSCVPCRKNRYCRSASSYECFRYHEGFFCEGGADNPFLLTSLPGEYYKLNETLRAYTRESCGPGTYTPDKHNSKCLPCPYGKYCDSSNLAAPSGTCYEGYYCVEGSTSPRQNLCKAGHICTGGLRALCPAGYYCSTTGLFSPTGICPVDNMCPKGSTVPVPCPGGTTQPKQGQTNCI